MELEMATRILDELWAQRNIIARRLRSPPATYRSNANLSTACNGATARRIRLRPMADAIEPGLGTRTAADQDSAALNSAKKFCGNTAPPLIPPKERSRPQRLFLDFSFRNAAAESLRLVSVWGSNPRTLPPGAACHWTMGWDSQSVWGGMESRRIQARLEDWNSRES